MQKFLRFLCPVITSSLLSLALVGMVNAQSYKVEGQDPEFDDLPSPEFSGGKQKSVKPKEWLEMEAGMKIQMAPEPKSKTAERVTVKWYVAVEHPDKRNAYLLLTKDITHVNVPLNEEIFSSVYLSPSSIKRLTGEDRAGKRIIYSVGYEVLINGVKLAESSSKGKPGWWNASSSTISRSDTVPLLSKDETAFANHWWDRYAEILVERR
ncbi:MAG: Amuc_1102 family pilus-like protein [Luteolibacter sp.]